MIFRKSCPILRSLKLMTGSELNREVVFWELCAALEGRYLQLKRSEYDAMNEDFELLLYRRDEWHYFQSGRFIFEGMIKGVDPRGRLLVRA